MTNMMFKLIQLFLMLFLLNQNCFSANGQAFDGINYINPADGLFVDVVRLSAGAMAINPKIKFNGTVNDNSSKIVSNPLMSSPYGRLIYRVNPNLALSVASFEPFRNLIKFNFQKQGFSDLFDGDNVRTFTIQPSIAFKALENLWIGAGVNITNFNAKITIVIPTEIVPSSGVARFNGRDLAFSSALGALYFFNPSTFLDVSFFSQTKAELKGYSGINNVNVPTSIPSELKIPNTLAVSFNKFFLNKKLLIRLGMSRTFWDQFLQNSVDLPIGNILFPLDYISTNRYTIFGHYDFSTTYGISLFAAKDYAPTSSAGYSNFSLAGDILSTGIALTRNITKSFSITATAGYAFNTSQVVFSEPSLNTFGNLKNQIMFTDLQFTYNLDK